MLVTSMLGAFSIVADVIFGVVPVIMFIVVIATIITIVRRAARGGTNNNSENLDKPKSERQLKNEEMIVRLKQIYNEHKEQTEQLKQEAKASLRKADEIINDIDLKSNRCKNCGAELELDKNGRKKCPYCQSKYF